MGLPGPPRPEPVGRRHSHAAYFRAGDPLEASGKSGVQMTPSDAAEPAQHDQYGTVGIPVLARSYPEL